MQLMGMRDQLQHGTCISHVARFVTASEPRQQSLDLGPSF